ncbi:MAG: hypothetical protein NPINA01_03100 [Nitrospinaceae bacterium]|nr:MAG: hypothetical protein NPINA01_03100 [Nitrospinaceae bacterium]
MTAAFRSLYGTKHHRRELKTPDKKLPGEDAVRNGVLKKGVTLIGLPRAIIGEGEFVRQTAKSFQNTSLDFGIYDTRPSVAPVEQADPLSSHMRSDNPFNVNIFHLKPDQLASSVVTLGRSFVENRYNIGYWAWELSEFPDAWQAPLDFLDEVWCPSRFIQFAVKKKSSKPVLYLPVSVELEISEGLDRAYFSLPSHSFIFLFVFDFKSYVARKNPSACIQAFTKAFPRGDEAVTLVIKSMDGPLYPLEFDRLAEEAKKDPRIILIDAAYRAEEITGLMQNCDCFISLHRSEGIGLSLAQSMLLGKPVIATGYSGNTDFMHDDNSCLVKYGLIAVEEKEYPFGKGQVWADPDVDHAAWYMRRLVEDEEYRKTIAMSGQATIRTHHNCLVIGKAYEDRLKALNLV